LVFASQAHAGKGILGVKLVEVDGKVIINEVIPNTSAAKAGLQTGDILVKVGTTDIKSLADALKAKEDAPDNQDVPFIVKTSDGQLWPLNAKFGGEGVIYSTTVARPKK